MNTFVPNLPEHVSDLARCGLSALSVALHMRAGQTQLMCPARGMELRIECHESITQSHPDYYKHDWRFWSINDQSVGNSYGLIAAVTEMLLHHAITQTAQRAELIVERVFDGVAPGKFAQNLLIDIDVTPFT